MTAIDLILFAIASMGLTHIIADSSLMEPVRRWLRSFLPAKIGEALGCHQCMGFWSGLLCGLMTTRALLPLLLLGFAGSWLGMVSDTVLSLMEAHTRTEDIDEED